jgi:hypothetical protein
MTQAQEPGALPPPDISAAGLPGEEHGDPSKIPPEYWRAFGIVAYTMNRFIVDHMLRAARLFDNDTEALVLFGVLSHLNVAHLLPPGSRPSTTLDARGTVPDSQPSLKPVRLRDLAQITGRPRETIRRKLERLEADGRVLRLADGYVLNVASVGPDMRALTMDGARRLMETSVNVGAALRDAARVLESAAPPSQGPKAKP